MLIAEDVLLLLLDDETGKLTASYVDTALGGALLVELALAGAVEVRPGKGLVARRKVVPTGPLTTDDPVLARAHALVAEKERTAQDLVDRLGKGVREELLAGLVDRGVLERRDDKVLGLFPRHRWPAVDSSHEDQVRRQLTAVLVAGGEPDERTAALVGLLHAIGRAEKCVDHAGLSAAEVRARAKRVAEGDWTAKAVRDAVQASQAATMAAVTAATVAATSAGT